MIFYLVYSKSKWWHYDCYFELVYYVWKVVYTMASGTIWWYRPFCSLTPLDFKYSPSHYLYHQLSPSYLKLLPLLPQILALSTLNSFPLYLKLLPSHPLPEAKDI